MSDRRPCNTDVAAHTTLGVLPSLSAADYHDDAIGDVPTLSASIAKLLIQQSPLHAYTQHPKLNPYYRREEEDRFSIGTVAHAVLLEGRDIVEVIEADSWRTNAAKEARDLARANGKVPLLGKDYFDVMAMVDAARTQLDAHEARPVLFSAGKPEQTITWTDEKSGVLCRARIDWLHDDYSAADDLKSTGRSARHEDTERLIYSMGYDLQAAFYVRGVQTVTGVTPEFRFVFVETSAPYALSVCSPSPAMYALADWRLDKALVTWRECLDSGVWPGYPNKVATVEPPSWAEAQILEREAA